MNETIGKMMFRDFRATEGKQREHGYCECEQCGMERFHLFFKGKDGKKYNVCCSCRAVEECH